ncbi:holo-ACP synthase [Paenibacillus sp.]|uniref:holo-ACP synthase n=1 Tax=Paenibacillus sp. TaxID=58172 RepID=UPI002D4D77F8|nr:holo-ACP synthase [Paenibacillus sp.]HZG87593.1 holo-ACP synthase [Paenibacillus sp.]
MIIGIGTDIIGLERIGKLLEGARGEAFLRRVLTEKEQAYFVQKRFSRARSVEFVAGRWAAKEAVAKALGCGIGAELGFCDIEVLPDERGRPACTVARPIAEGLVVHVSISHADGWASAFAVAERL